MGFTIWRKELLHPAVVHFPISFLVLGALLYFSVFLIKSKKLKHQLKFCSNLLFVLALITTGLAIWTGENAHSVVNRSICDPTLTHLHESWAWILIYLMAAYVLTEICSHSSKFFDHRVNFVIQSLIVLLAVGVIVYTSHLGASLVYLQAAAVYRPSEDCREFQ